MLSKIMSYMFFIVYRSSQRLSKPLLMFAILVVILLSLPNKLFYGILTFLWIISWIRIRLKIAMSPFMNLPPQEEINARFYGNIKLTLLFVVATTECV